MTDPRLLAQALSAPRGGHPSPQQTAAQLALFIGPQAKNWNWQGAGDFVRNEQQAMPPEQNWQSSGTFRNPYDGMMRQEIPDNGMQVKPDASGFLPSVVQHPAMFEAYPQLQDHTMRTETPGIFDNPAPYGWNQGRDTYINAPPDEPMNRTAVHESQHKIQNIEGFAQGGPPKNWDVRRPNDFISPEAYSEYLAIPGEIEARAAAARMDLTPEERRALFPLKSFDLIRGPISEGAVTAPRDPRTWQRPIR